MGGGGGGWYTLDYNVISGPFLSYEIEIVDGPGPELHNYVLETAKLQPTDSSLVPWMKVTFGFMCTSETSHETFYKFSMKIYFAESWETIGVKLKPHIQINLLSFSSPSLIFSKVKLSA